MMGDGLHDIRVRASQSLKTVGLQKFQLKGAEPYLNLVQPGSTDRQPVGLDPQPPTIGFDLFLQPASELFGSARGAVVQDQSQGMNTAR